MSPPRILVTRKLPDAVERELVARWGATIRAEYAPLPREALARALAENDIVLSTITDKLDAGLLQPGLRCRLLANFGAGMEHIDLVAAKAAGIAVTNTPGALTGTTAELALTLMLMTARRAGEGERSLRAGQWQGWTPTDRMGQGLSGKLLGLVGYGRIAQATARLARAFGMRIGYYTRTPQEQPDAEAFASLEALAEAADVLSLHTPGGEGTRHLVNPGLLARMKPTAILINTARGSVVDEAALAEALKSGQIAAAGLDVYEREPQVHPALLECENAVLLPHLGSATLETRTAMGMQALRNIAAWIEGRDLPDRVA